MIRIYQNKKDNCFAACVCSILNLSVWDLDRMPQHTKPGWFVPFKKHMRQNYGFDMICVRMSSKEVEKEFELLPDVLCIMTGDSPYTKDCSHSVVGRYGKLVFDPKPEGKGILGECWEWEYCFLVKIFD